MKRFLLLAGVLIGLSLATVSAHQRDHSPPGISQVMLHQEVPAVNMISAQAEQSITVFNSLKQEGGQAISTYEAPAVSIYAEPGNYSRGTVSLRRLHIARQHRWYR